MGVYCSVLYCQPSSHRRAGNHINAIFHKMRAQCALARHISVMATTCGCATLSWLNLIELLGSRWSQGLLNSYKELKVTCDVDFSCVPATWHHSLRQGCIRPMAHLNLLESHCLYTLGVSQCCLINVLFCVAAEPKMGSSCFTKSCR